MFASCQGLCLAPVSQLTGNFAVKQAGQIKLIAKSRAENVQRILSVTAVVYITAVRLVLNGNLGLFPKYFPEWHNSIHQHFLIFFNQFGSYGKSLEIWIALHSSDLFEGTALTGLFAFGFHLFRHWTPFSKLKKWDLLWTILIPAILMTGWEFGFKRNSDPNGYVSDVIHHLFGIALFFLPRLIPQKSTDNLLPATEMQAEA
jgi:hypothetical protein